MRAIELAERIVRLRAERAQAQTLAPCHRVLRHVEPGSRARHL
jgi:hypothetical protein